MLERRVDGLLAALPELIHCPAALKLEAKASQWIWHTLRIEVVFLQRFEKGIQFRVAGAGEGDQEPPSLFRTGRCRGIGAEQRVPCGWAERYQRLTGSANELIEQHQEPSIRG